METEKRTTISVNGSDYVFSGALTMGQEIDMVSRRADMCKGYFDQLINSKNIQEQIVGFNASRICEIDAYLYKTPPGWSGAEKLSYEEVDSIWKEWTDKSGRFSKKDATASDGEDGGNSETSGKSSQE